jgi:hypothetical protein
MRYALWGVLTGMVSECLPGATAIAGCDMPLAAISALLFRLYLPVSANELRKRFASGEAAKPAGPTALI